MLKPITCNSCRKALGWFDSSTGCLKSDDLPKGLNVFGAFLICPTPSCNQRVVKFDGLVARKNLIKNLPKNVREKFKFQPKALVSTPTNDKIPIQTPERFFANIGALATASVPV